MQRSYYLLKDGHLIRKENTLYFATKEGKTPLPVEAIYELHIFGSVTVSSQALHYLAQKGIPVHFYNRYGFYDGSFVPRKSIVSGDLVVRQVAHYLNPEKRLYLARKFVEGSIKNMGRTLGQYGLEWDKEAYLDELNSTGKLTEIMNVEGRARADYYSLLDQKLPEEFRIVKRTRRPPSNYGNSLVSFGNSLLYGVTVAEIYRTGLHGGVSYLHEPLERRYSLALDISDIFKPFLVDRLVVYLVNKGVIKPAHFREEGGGILLNERGKRKFLEAWNERLRKTVRHRGLRRNVSYRRLIRLELYKLIKHLTGIKRYEPFVIWW